MPGRIPPWPARAALALVSAGLTLLCAETYFRSVAYHVGNYGRLEELERQDPVDRPAGSNVKRKHQIRLSANPRMVYEHRPGLRLTDERGNVYTINATGFRGPDYPIEKEAGVLRIVGLGDSYMYGNGVSDDDIFMARLSRRLNEHAAAERWQLINTAVGGYNTVMEVETLKEKGLQYDPDIVLILFVGNDLDLPNFIREPVSFFAPRSFLVDWVRDRTHGAVRRRLRPAPQADEGNWFERDPAKVPAAYRRMVGPAAYRRAMRELADLSNRHGFELVVLQTDYRDLVTDTCRELDLPLVHFQPALQEYMERHGIDRYRGSVLSVSATDPHPSSQAHEIMAQVVFDYLEESGALDRARSRVRRAG